MIPLIRNVISRVTVNDGLLNVCTLRQAAVPTILRDLEQPDHYRL